MPPYNYAPPSEYDIARSNGTLNTLFGGRRPAWMSDAQHVAPTPRPRSLVSPQNNAQHPPARHMAPADALPSPVTSDEPSPANSNPHDSPVSNNFPTPLNVVQGVTPPTLTTPVQSMVPSVPRSVAGNATAISAASAPAPPPPPPVNSATPIPSSDAVPGNNGLPTPGAMQPPEGTGHVYHALPARPPSLGLGLNSAVAVNNTSAMTEQPDGEPASKRRRVTRNLERPYENWIKTIEQFRRQHLAQVPESSSEQRFCKHLIEALKEQDGFYIVFHQLFSLWALGRPVLMPNMSPEDINRTWSGIQIAVLSGRNISKACLEWFAAFPYPRESFAENMAGYPVIFNLVSSFFSRMHTVWPSFSQLPLSRKFPRLVKELLDQLNCRSTILQRMIFWTTGIRLLGPENMDQALEIFRSDQNRHRSALSPEQVTEWNMHVIRAYMVVHCNGQRQPTSARVPGNSTSPSPLHGGESRPQTGRRDSSVGIVPPNQGVALQQSFPPLGPVQNVEHVSGTSPPQNHGGFIPNSLQQPGQVSTPSYYAVSPNFQAQQLSPGFQGQPGTGMAPPSGFPHQAFQEWQMQQNALGHGVRGLAGMQASMQMQMQMQAQAREVANMQPGLSHQQQQGSVILFGQNSFTPAMASGQFNSNVQPAQAPFHPGQSQVQQPGIVRQGRLSVQATPLATPPATTAWVPGWRESRQALHAAALIPPPDDILYRSAWPYDPSDPRSVSVALHQTDLRSPKRIRSPSKDGAAATQNERYYQFIRHFAVSPTALPPRSHLHEFEFFVSDEVVPMLSRSITPRGEFLPISKYFNGSLRYRLRTCRSAKSDMADTEFVVSDCLWPSNIFMKLNDQSLTARRAQHNGRDLATELTSQLVPGKNILKVALPKQKISSKAGFFLAVEVIETLSHSEVLDRIWRSGVVPAEKTLKEIKKRLSPGRDDDDDDDGLTIVNPDISIDLADPFTALMFRTPVRGVNCTHMECFDLETWLQTRPRKSPPKCAHTLPCSCPKLVEPSNPDKWRCPICLKDARPASLRIDSFLLDIRKQLEAEGKVLAKTLLVSADGKWKAVLPAQDSVEEADMGQSSTCQEMHKKQAALNQAHPPAPIGPAPAQQRQSMEVIDLSDD